MKPRVRVIDDDVETGELVARRLEALGFTADVFDRPSAALLDLETSGVDVVLTDLEMPELTGLEVCREVLSRVPDVPVVLMTGYGTMESVLSALRAGAYDFLAKPVGRDALDVAMARAMEHRSLRREVARLRIDSGEPFEGLLGNSAPMRRVFSVVDRVARSRASVLLRGESGTGKELLARALHARSRRADGPFVAVNCAAVPENLLESELFGHEKGAYTGADAARTGLFREAHGGTLLLDEIGEMSPALQPKLLRALQERSVRPVGGDRELKVDVRVIAATHQDIEEAIEAGRFRADLYYRLAVVSVRVPPLRERTEDVPTLAAFFLTEACERDGRAPLRLAPSALGALDDYTWPGNVRELKNAMEHAAALAEGDLVTPADLPEAIARDASPGEPTDDRPFLPLLEVERRHVVRVYEAVGRNKSEAARLLGIDRKTLGAKLRRFGLP